MFEFLKVILTGGKVIERAIDRVLPPQKLSEEERLKLTAAIQEGIEERIEQNDQKLREFFIEYEGAAEKVHPLVQIVRGLVRPLITYYSIGMFSWTLYYIFGRIATLETVKMDYLMRIIQLEFYVVAIVLVFWFGDRFLQKSGALDALITLFGKRKE